MSNITDFNKWKAKRKKIPKNKRRFSVLSRKRPSEQVTREDFLQKYESFDVNKAETFKDFPFSTKTSNALIKAEFLKPTPIQKASILPALKGKDILGSAKTGSGKTLAFIIPILENLYLNKWNSSFGAAAVVISPTRELAYQTFEVLRKVGHKHDFSAGLVIGGKSAEDEAKHIHKTNILICTPGRLLQHMDQTHSFSGENIKIMVLDEADKLLEMGFEKTLNAILQNIPSDRQTLLFSATQTKSVKSLAKLCLKDPAYIDVSSESVHSTPNSLKQRYLICELQDKVNLLYSFLRSHLKAKTLVFFNSCKQVQFIYHAFCRLRPGISIMHLHGRMNQIKRMAFYKEFCRKKSAVMFATDVASRGLDFPAVDWVLQLDCPEDVQTYIHRAGRTARLHEKGNGLLVLLPTEVDGMLNELKKSRVPVEKSEINPKKLTSIESKMQSLCAEDKEMKERAQRSFVAYSKSVLMMKNKNIFKVEKLPFKEYSSSLGLAIPPRLRFLEKKFGLSTNVSTATKVIDLKESLDQMNSRSERIDTLERFAVDEEDDDNFMIINRTDIFKEDESLQPESQVNDVVSKPKKKLTKAAEAKRLLRKGISVNQRITFDDEGDLDEVWPPVGPLAEGDEDLTEVDGINVEKAQETMKERDLVDKAKHRMKVREKKLLRRKKEKQLRLGDKGHKNAEDEGVAFLPSADEEDEMSERSDEDYSESSASFDDEDAPVSKRAKFTDDTSMFNNPQFKMSLQEEEELALHLLRK